MHYKNGREAKVGDPVIGKDYQGLPFSGIVAKTNPGSTTCNLVVVPIPVLGVQSAVTAGECVHVDDALNVSAPEAESQPQG